MSMLTGKLVDVSELAGKLVDVSVLVGRLVDVSVLAEKLVDVSVLAGKLVDVSALVRPRTGVCAFAETSRQTGALCICTRTHARTHARASSDGSMACQVLRHRCMRLPAHRVHVLKLMSHQSHIGGQCILSFLSEY